MEMLHSVLKNRLIIYVRILQVCSCDTLRILLSLLGWKIQHIGVQAAFLQGRKITRYIRTPFEAESVKIWKLNKCIDHVQK